MTDKKRVHVYISGRVQGVGFRAFTQRTAQQLGVKGWVKNLSDGRVEAVFSGPAETVDKILEKVQTGPRFAQVKELDVREEKYKNEVNGFEVRY